MDLKSKYLKFLTSIFILLFFVVFLSPFSFATEDDFTEYFGNDFPSNFTLFLYDRLVENYSTQLNNYDYCIALCYEGYGSSSSSYGGFYVYFTNDSTLNFTNGTYNASGYYENFGSTNTSGEMVQVYISMGRPSYITRFTDYKYNLFGFNASSNIPEGQTISKRLHFYKGENNITLDNNDFLYKLLPSYDISFSVLDESSNTEHNFDFNVVDGEFNDGRYFTADDLASGHYIVSISSLVHNSYDLGDNEFLNTYWVSGYLDYIDYSNVTDSKTQFYWSSGYEEPKILNESDNPLIAYRFSFRGYSSDSFNYDDLVDSTNTINIRKSDFCSYDKYSFPSGSTFTYSNRDIYYAIDTSMYGFNGLTNRLFFDESTYGSSGSISVSEIKTNEILSDSSFVDNQVTSFALNNDSYTYPSSSVNLGTNYIKTYDGVYIDSVSPYGALVNYSGNSNPKATDDLTENWGVLDYLMILPNLISRIPDMIGDKLRSLFIPNMTDLWTEVENMSKWCSEHFGSFYTAVDFVVDILKEVNDRYTSTYSQYPFAIPGIRWYNPIKGEKEVLVESRVIDLGAICMDDDDWLQFWSTTRYLTSFLIYLNLIIMLFNKFRAWLGYGPIGFNPSSVIGSIKGFKDYNDEVNESIAYSNSRLKRLRDSRVDHTWSGPTM